MWLCLVLDNYINLFFMSDSMTPRAGLKLRTIPRKDELPDVLCMYNCTMYIPLASFTAKEI